MAVSLHLYFTCLIILTNFCFKTFTFQDERIQLDIVILSLTLIILLSTHINIHYYKLVSSTDLVSCMQCIDTSHTTDEVC